MDENQPRITPGPLSEVTAPEEDPEIGIARITRDKEGKLDFFVSGVFKYDREALIYALEKVKTTIILASCLESDG